jgi:hypothetical protein
VNTLMIWLAICPSRGFSVERAPQDTDGIGISPPTFFAEAYVTCFSETGLQIRVQVVRGGPSTSPADALKYLDSALFAEARELTRGKQ